MRLTHSAGTIALAITLAVLAPSAAQASGGIAELPVQSAQTNGEVDAIAISGNVAYLGGAFTKMRPAGNPAGSGEVARNHLAAVDLTTGKLLPWNPGANNDVRALTVSPDGSTVYAGGLFTTLGGSKRNRLGSVTSGGALTTWNPNANNEVRALAIAGTRLYVGGRFTTIAGASRSRLAAFSLATGALDTGWKPSANNWITSLAPSRDGSGQIFAGGYFTTINGVSGQAYLARLDGITGAPAAFQTHPTDHVDALAVTGTQVFAGEGGPGGKAQGYNQGSGQLQWTAQFDGDVQAIAAGGNLVYVGGHFVEYCIGGTGAGAPFVCDDPLSRGKLAAVRQSDGAIDDWNPQSNGALGDYAMAVTADGLAVGGQMTTYGLDLPSAQQVHQQGFADFGPSGTDGQPPTAPTALHSSGTTQTSVSLAWTAATDNTAVTNYRIYRDGNPIATIGNTTAYTDSGLSPATQHTYTVTAHDAAANESAASNQIQATTQSAGPMFSDGFESGDLSAWNHVTGAVSVESTDVFDGGFAADAAPSGSPARAWAAIPAQTDLTYDLEFKVLSKTSSTIDLLALRSASNGILLKVSLAGASNLLRVRNAVSATTLTAASPSVTTGTWHHLGVHLVIAGASGHTDVTLDGSAVSDLTRTWNTGSTPIARLQIGDSTAQPNLPGGV